MDILVGYTGFVGSNIAAHKKFDGLYNSSNIRDAYGTRPDLCVYAGMRAEKFLANKDPEGDMAMTDAAFRNITEINPRRLVLISTVDVLKVPNGAVETDPNDISGLDPYGYDRAVLENRCREAFDNCHIIRLPALFGKNIKKNFIYDMINYIPSMLNGRKYAELSDVSPLIRASYELLPNGFYKLIPECDRQALKSEFRRVGFSALMFTDSRARYQYYDLSFLWSHTEKVIENNIPLFHAAVEPVSAAEIYEAVTGQAFVNEISESPICYDFRTIYDREFGGNNGYIFDRQKVIDAVRAFVGDRI